MFGSWSRISVLVFCLMAAAMLDTCVLSWSSPKSLFRVIAGETQPIAGKLARPVDPELLESATAGQGGKPDKDLAERVLTYDPQPSGIRIRFLSVEGRLWRAILQTSADLREGPYQVRVFSVGEKPDENAARFTIRVFADEQSYRNSFYSLSKRLTGLEPWWVALLLFPACLYCIYRVMRQTAREDADLQAQGIGPIYKLAKRSTHWEVLFGLGSSHGIQTGDRLAVMGPQRKVVGFIEVTQVGSESASGELALDAEIAPNYLIAKRGG